MYLELPTWVENLTESLVETDEDAPSVRALKRFLAGSPEYRQHRLKLLPELVQAPYAIRLMAPKANAPPPTVHQEGLVTTKYHEHDVGATTTSGSSSGVETTVNKTQAPIFEVTMDLMEQRTVRSMACLVKRYLPSMSIDFALVISKPDGSEDEEPEAVLGMWRWDHLQLTEYPSLPDRLATDGCSRETLDAVRASLLAKEASRMSLSIHPATRANGTTGSTRRRP